MKVGPKSSLRPFLHRALQLFAEKLQHNIHNKLFSKNEISCSGCKVLKNIFI